MISYLPMPTTRRQLPLSTVLLCLVAAAVTTARANEPLVVDGPDWKLVTKEAAWKPRDSSGEMVFEDKLWLLGGWFNSYEAPPRDVWASGEGKTWSLTKRRAPWKYSDLPMTIAFADRMWLMGGWYNGRLEGHGATNEVWSSADGVTWDLAGKATWSPRAASAIVKFKGRMWILGGTENYYFGDEGSLNNDVWSSADGKEWRLETADAGWAPRAYHQAAVLDGKIYLFGGGNYVPEYRAFNDVWASSDGTSWEQVTESAPWSPRLWFSSVVYRDRMWVLGGWSNHPSKNWQDVWFSKDGRDWRRLRSKVIWKERHEHSTYVFQDKIIVAGGMTPPLVNDVWSLELPEDFGKGD
ncbi:Kelch motif protein [Planctomycetes bacterium Pan216]|uniref:Kelch motif protein n=1 Tax=Kolteria novifilia TaxID=2527975 RepID=A0A518BAJ7_9BACT|nr:Kelch motif protein [Planctomycetes bacterium Pan216]